MTIARETGTGAARGAGIPSPHRSPAPAVDVVLFEPEIPPNTGNVIRLCANAGVDLHLIRPLGFELSDARLRRAGLDYHEYATLRVHDDLSAFLTGHAGPVWALSTRGARCYTEAPLDDDAALLFGPETRGLPPAVLARVGPEQTLRIPMRPGVRSLNLGNAVAVVVYDVRRRQGFPGLS